MSVELTQHYRDIQAGDIRQDGDQFSDTGLPDTWTPVNPNRMGREYLDYEIESGYYRRPVKVEPPYTVTELHTPQGSLDAVTKRCERAEKALGVAVAALKKIKMVYDNLEDMAGVTAKQALVQIEALNTDTEK